MEKPSGTNDPRQLRRIAYFGGSLLGLWWFVPHFIDPDAYNPLGSRLFVVALMLGIGVASKLSPRFERNLPAWFTVGVIAITAQNYSLFYYNHAKPEWMTGVYLTVAAACAVIPTRRTLYAFGVALLVMSAALAAAHEDIRRSFLIPGVLTIWVYSFLGLRARLVLLEKATESSERFAQLFNATFEGIVVHDQVRVVDCNDPLAALFGYSRAELIGRDVLDLVPPEDRPEAQQQAAALDDLRVRCAGLRKDGSRFPLEFASKRFPYGGPELRLMTVRDLSESVRLEEERRLLTAAQQAQENAERKNELKSTFLSLVGHELVTPLQTILMSIHPSSWASAGLDEPHRQKLARIERAARRLLALIQSLLEYARLERSSFPVERQRFDAAVVLGELTDELAELADQKQLQLSLDCPSPFPIESDPKLFRIICSNLVVNALRYTDAGSVRVSLRRKPGTIELLVEDTGIGISVADQLRIFEAFTQVGELRHKHSPGVGLGLAIVRETTRLLGGSVLCHSEPGHGSRFLVTLPEAPPSEPPGGTPEPPSVDPAP